MKNAKRWLAVILAVTLLGSNAVYQLGTTLSANETEAVTESQQDESENAVAEQAEKQQEDTGKATVQEVTPLSLYVLTLPSVLSGATCTPFTVTFSISNPSFRVIWKLKSSPSVTSFTY